MNSEVGALLHNKILSNNHDYIIKMKETLELIAFLHTSDSQKIEKKIQIYFVGYYK